MKESENWLNVKSIEVWDQNKKIFDDLSLKLSFHENTVLLGPNGSGKTSIIRLINRSLYPKVKSNSYFKLFGTENINIWEVRKRVGFLLTELENRIYKNEAVNDVIKTGLYNTYRIPCYETKKISNEKSKLDMILEILELNSISDYPFKILSDGQKRRTLIGRALIHDPDILILDEPTSKLDIKSKYIILKCLENLCSSGKTLIQITHDITTISESINRVIFIRNGEIIDDGIPSDLLTDKKLSHLFDMNLRVYYKNKSWTICPFE